MGIVHSGIRRAWLSYRFDEYHWDGDGWHIGPSSVVSAVEWGDNDRVFSRASRS